MPPLPRKESPTEGHLMGVVRRRGQPAEGAWVNIINLAENRTARAVEVGAGGFFGVVGLPPGDYKVVAYLAPLVVEPFSRPWTRIAHIEAGRVTDLRIG